MIKTAFTCNSLRAKHFFRILPTWLFSPRSLQHTQDCKAALSDYFDVRPESVFLFGSARMGLYSLLVSGETEAKDEVIVAGYTCVVVTNAIKYADMKAVYIDVEEESLNIDQDLLRDAITPRTRAIIITHNFGITCEYIDQIKQDFPDVMIIEDAAHTFGSLAADGRKAGTLGDASFFSLEYSKPLTTGMGGIVLVNDKKLSKRLNEYYAELPYYPRFTNLRILVSLKIHLFSSSRYNAFLKRWMAGGLYILGLLYKSPPGELQGERPKHYPVKLIPYMAQLLLQQIREIDIINLKKAALCRKYRDTLDGIPFIQQYFKDNYNFVRYPILIDQSVGLDKVTAIKSEMKQAGIVSGDWFNDVVHPAGSLRYCYIDGSCPTGESITARMINLPVSIHRQLNKRDLAKMKRIFIKHLGTK